MERDSLVERQASAPVQQKAYSQGKMPNTAQPDQLGDEDRAATPTALGAHRQDTNNSESLSEASHSTATSDSNISFWDSSVLWINQYQEPKSMTGSSTATSRASTFLTESALPLADVPKKSIADEPHLSGSGDVRSPLSRTVTHPVSPTQARGSQRSKFDDSVLYATFMRKARSQKPITHPTFPLPHRSPHAPAVSRPAVSSSLRDPVLQKISPMEGPYCMEPDMAPDDPENNTLLSLNEVEGQGLGKETSNAM